MRVNFASGVSSDSTRHLPGRSARAMTADGGVVTQRLVTPAPSCQSLLRGILRGIGFGGDWNAVRTDNRPANLVSFHGLSFFLSPDLKPGLSRLKAAGRFSPPPFLAELRGYDLGLRERNFVRWRAARGLEFRHLARQLPQCAVEFRALVDPVDRTGPHMPSPSVLQHSSAKARFGHVFLHPVERPP